MGGKDIANILTITCFPGCFFFCSLFLVLQVDALCFCTSSCQLTRQHLFLYVRSSVVWTYFRSRDETEGPGTCIGCCTLYGDEPEARYRQYVSMALGITGDWSDTQNMRTIEFFNVNSVIVHTAVLWTIFENYCRHPQKGLSLFCVYTCTPEINVIDKYL